MIFHRLDHYLVLHARVGYLHSAGMPDAGVGNIAIAGYFIGGSDNDDALSVVIRQDAGNLPQHGRLAYPRLAQQQDAFPWLNEVLDYIHRTKNSPAYPASQADYASAPAAHGRDAMKRALQSGAIISGKLANARDDVIYIGLIHLLGVKHHLAEREAGFGKATQVQNNFEQFAAVGLPAEGLSNMCRQDIEQSS